MAGKERDISETFSDDWGDEAEPAAGDVLIVDLDGFEGPLDLLLVLSRSRKIDLKAVSIAALAEQYIRYIDDLKLRRLEIAADYLVMAAWLIYLKSKLLLPSLDEDEGAPSGDELAARLAFRLKRLDAMRRSARALMELPQLGDDFFARPDAPGIEVVARPSYRASQYDLFSAYAKARQRGRDDHYKVRKRQVWSIKKARERLRTMLGFPVDWAPINDLIAAFLKDETLEKTTVASTFGASLEMARDGEIHLRQDGHFRPLYIKFTDKKDQGDG